jgi:CDP-6-deoxy-D-xylo-4-hexulose-3-dehydrase
MRNVSVGTFTVTERMRELVNEVLDSGRISYGPKCKALEQQFASIHDSTFGVLSNSGTSSLQVALQALKEIYGWSDGDEVIVPSVTFVATLNIVLHNRLKPVVVDVEPDMYGLDIEKLEEAFTNKTRCILPVHLFGMPCDISRVVVLADTYNVRVVEDSCECMFVEHKNRKAGSWGDVGCFSTYVAHLITSGVGGIGITDDEEVALRMRSLVNHGRDNVYISMDDDDNLSEAALQEVVGKRMHFHHIGHSFRITELEAALALAQLETWPDMIAQRQFNAKLLSTRLCRFPELQLPKHRPLTGHAYMMYPIVVKGPHKWDIVHHLESNGIETREMLPLTNQPAYRDWLDPGLYPVADMINRCGFYIGCHQDLSMEDIDYVCYQFERFYG